MSFRTEKQMIIMQGVAGSGKSEIAKMFEEYLGALVCSNNDHMVDEEGNYCFDPSRLKEVADKCYHHAVMAVKQEFQFIVIDNTNCMYREAEQYIKLGMENGYRIQVVRTERSSSECISENIHNVPEHTILRRHSMMESLVR